MGILPGMVDVATFTEWLGRCDGVATIEIEGDSPTRLRVEFATQERAEQFLSMTALIDNIRARSVGNGRIVIEDDSRSHSKVRSNYP